MSTRKLFVMFKNNRCLDAVKVTLKLFKVQRKDVIVYNPSVTHCDNTHCGHLVSILESQLGKPGFKSCPGTVFIEWGFLFPQALSLNCPDIDLPLTIHLLARYSTLHTPKTLNIIHKIFSDMQPYSHRLKACQLTQKFMY